MKTVAESFGIDLRTGCGRTLAADDIVQIGSNRGPDYRIVHIAHGTAWVRPLANGEEGLVQVNRLRRVGELG